MTPPRNHPRIASLAATTAFGIASLASISLAAAHPTTPPPPERMPPTHTPGDRDGSIDYDLDDDGTLEHVEKDYRHYDTDRDGILERSERTAYWSHMFDMGTFGSDLTPADKLRLARIAFLFDRDADGRLTGSERRAIARLIRARRLFTSLDRNGDDRVSMREARLIAYGTHDRYYQDSSYKPYAAYLFFWNRHRPDQFRSTNWIAAQFEALDRNRDARVSWYEVESHILRTFRRDVRP